MSSQFLADTTILHFSLNKGASKGYELSLDPSSSYIAILNIYRFEHDE